MHNYENGVLVTPEMAAQWIEAGVEIQRTMKPAKVKEFSTLMSAGMWKYPNGQPIIFNEDGVMCDGQNRCQAIVNTGLPQRFDIVRGIPRDNMIGIDNCTARSHSDLYVMTYKRYNIPIKHAKAASAAMRFVVSYEKGNIYKCGVGVSPVETQEAEERHRGIIESVKMLNKHNLLANKSACISMHYLLRQNPIKREKVDEFFQKFLDGTGLEKGCPILALRNRCIRDRDMQKAQRPHVHIAWIMRCFTKFFNGEKLYNIVVYKGAPPEIVI